jgi:hypothetical protein
MLRAATADEIEKVRARVLALQKSTNLEDQIVAILMDTNIGNHSFHEAIATIKAKAILTAVQSG